MSDSGRGDSHRSGFHSSASEPHRAGFRFEALIPTTISVPSGTKISFIIDPSVALMGADSGITISFRVLRYELKVNSCTEKNSAYILGACVRGGKLTCAQVWSADATSRTTESCLQAKGLPADCIEVRQ